MTAAPGTDEARWRRIGLLSAAGVLLIGIGYLAILPPFEGFDEPAHYSSARQIAYTGTVPIRGRSFIDRFVQDYEKAAPMPWGSRNPPFDQTGSMTYRSFFADAKAVADYRVYQDNPAADTFVAGSNANWESQHPPLYYLLMAPLVRLTERLPFLTQIFVLRIASYLLAFAGLMAGWVATARYAGKIMPGKVAATYMLFPIIVPMFFSEFARMGNDSLCLFFLGLAHIFSFRLFHAGEGDTRCAAGLGACLGLGLLTKALFLPVFASYAAFMALRVWSARGETVLRRSRMVALAVVFFVALIIGGGWYLYNFITYGSIVGGNEFVKLAREGGLLRDFWQRFSAFYFFYDLVGMAASWSWAGSWSLVHIAPFLQFLLLLLPALLIVNYAMEAWRFRFDDPTWLPAWVVGTFVGGLTYHILVARAVGITAGSGWYLNVLAPLLAVGMAIGVVRAERSGWERIVLGVLVIYSGFFLLAVLWAQMALFAGCAVKDDHKYYQFTGRLFCLDRIGTVVDHLSVLGWPTVALASFGIGFLCLTAGLISFIQVERTQRADRPALSASP